jgi:quercetin dioxygenase-like cupin family protein
MQRNIFNEITMRANLKTKPITAEILSTNLLNSIAHNLALVDVAPTRSTLVKEALMTWAAAETSTSKMPAALASDSVNDIDTQINTHHAFSGNAAARWRPINPLVSMQVLHDDGETLSWYARFQPGGRLPAHDHTGDEESLVISGSCYLNDRLMQVGDYQICRSGSRHDNVYSEHGCLLFIRTPKAMLRGFAQHDSGARVSA